MHVSPAERYDQPRLLASFSISELRADAAAAFPYTSDIGLKSELAPVERPLERLRRIGRG